MIKDKKDKKVITSHRGDTMSFLYYDVKIFHENFDSIDDYNKNAIRDHYGIVHEAFMETEQHKQVTNTITKVLASYDIHATSRTFCKSILGHTDAYESTVDSLRTHVRSLRFSDSVGKIVNPQDFSTTVKCALIIKSIVHIPVNSLNYLKLKNIKLHDRLNRNITSNDLSSFIERFSI